MKAAILAMVIGASLFSAALASEQYVVGTVPSYLAACQQGASKDPAALADALAGMHGVLENHSASSIGHAFVSALVVSGDASADTQHPEQQRHVEWTVCVPVPAGSSIGSPFKPVVFPATLVGGVICSADDHNCSSKLAQKLGIGKDSPRVGTFRSVPLDTSVLAPDATADGKKEIAIAEVAKTDRVVLTPQTNGPAASTSISINDADLTTKGVARPLLSVKFPDPVFTTDRDFHQGGLFVFVTIDASEPPLLAAP